MPLRWPKSASSPRTSSQFLGGICAFHKHGPSPLRVTPGNLPGVYRFHRSVALVDRQYRLREEHDVKRVRSRGRSVAHGALVLRYMPNNTDPAQNRYTVIAGKKCGNAVHRNRLKRIVREALRAWHPVLKPGHDLAFICRGGTGEMPDLAAAQETLHKILDRTDLLIPGANPPSIGEPVTSSWNKHDGEQE